MCVCADVCACVRVCVCVPATGVCVRVCGLCVLLFSCVCVYPLLRCTCEDGEQGQGVVTLRIPHIIYTYMYICYV